MRALPGSGQEGKNCYAFQVENVGLVASEGAAPWDPGVNELVVEIVESPEDDPENTTALLRHIFHPSFNDVSSYDEPIDLDLGELQFEVISRQTKKE